MSSRKNMAHVLMKRPFKIKRPTLIDSDGLAFSVRQPGNFFPDWRLSIPKAGRLLPIGVILVYRVWKDKSMIFCKVLWVTFALLCITKKGGKWWRVCLSRAKSGIPKYLSVCQKRQYWWQMTASPTLCQRTDIARRFFHLYQTRHGSGWYLRSRARQKQSKGGSL